MRANGADHVVRTDVPDLRESFRKQIFAAVGKGGADVIIDMVGASCLNDNLSAAALKGRIVGVGRMGGRHAQFDLDFMALRRITMIGVTTIVLAPAIHMRHRHRESAEQCKSS